MAKTLGEIKKAFRKDWKSRGGRFFRSTRAPKKWLYLVDNDFCILRKTLLAVFRAFPPEASYFILEGQLVVYMPKCSVSLKLLDKKILYSYNSRVGLMRAQIGGIESYLKGY